MEDFEVTGSFDKMRHDYKPFPEGCYWAPHVPCVYHAAKQNCPYCGPWRKMHRPWLAKLALVLAAINASVFLSSLVALWCGEDGAWNFVSVVINGLVALLCWRSYLKENMRYYTNALDAIASLDDGDS